MTRLWLLGDQLGPHFDDRSLPSVVIEVRGIFRRRRYHRQKAHLLLTAMRMRAREQDCRLVQADTFAEGIAALGEPVQGWHPHSRSAVRVAKSVGATGPRADATGS